MWLVRTAAGSLTATLLFATVFSAAAVATGVVFFDMRIAGALALYFVIWWTALFAVLPFGARSQTDAGEVFFGSDPGAPALPALNEKAIWTTIVATIVFTLVAWLLPLVGL